MLPDLDKSTLNELGVTAIGDQLLILKRIKAAKSSLSVDTEDDEDEVREVRKQKPRITGPSSASESASDHRRGKPPPDRHEIYHVKMPFGNTARTQKILEKADNMRKLGLAVRGTTGVRQGGRSVSPIDKTSLAARLIRKQNSEVSSTTDRRLQRFGVQGMHSDKMNGATKIHKVSNSGIRKPNTVDRLKMKNFEITGRESVIVSRPITSRNAPSDIRVDMPSSRKRRGNMSNRLSRNDRPKLLMTCNADYSDEYVPAHSFRDASDFDDDDITVEYMEEDDDTLQVPAPSSSSSVHQRISFATSSVPSRASSNRHRAPISSRLATVIDQSDSIFNRVSYHRN